MILRTIVRRRVINRIGYSLNLSTFTPCFPTIPKSESNARTRFGCTNLHLTKLISNPHPYYSNSARRYLRVSYIPEKSCRSDPWYVDYSPNNFLTRLRTESFDGSGEAICSLVLWTIRGVKEGALTVGMILGGDLEKSGECSLVLFDDRSDHIRNLSTYEEQ